LDKILTPEALSKIFSANNIGPDYLKCPKIFLRFFKELLSTICDSKNGLTAAELDSMFKIGEVVNLMRDMVAALKKNADDNAKKLETNSNSRTAANSAAAIPTGASNNSNDDDDDDDSSNTATGDETARDYAEQTEEGGTAGDAASVSSVSAAFAEPAEAAEDLKTAAAQDFASEAAEFAQQIKTGILDFNPVIKMMNKVFRGDFSSKYQGITWKLSLRNRFNPEKFGLAYCHNPHGAQVEKHWTGWRKQIIYMLERAGY
jgi:hypothetical protein